MVISFDRTYAAFISFSGVSVAEEFAVPRESFLAAFEIDAGGITQCNYEPDRGLYHVTGLVGDVEVYAKPEDHPVLAVLHTQREAIHLWFIDEINRANQPSKYHTYDAAAHAWTLTQEASVKLDASNVRRERNTLLTASDWSQLGDSPADKAAWATYRQELRDIPLQAGFPGSVLWPKSPV